VAIELWAKTADGQDPSYHPLILHLVDVAACAEAILDREPAATRKRMGEILGLSWEVARPWIMTLIACHDLGKACPGFQLKWPGATTLLSRSGIRIPRSVDTKINHAFVSQVSVSELLQERDWPEDLAQLVADAVGCHHGSRASPMSLEYLSCNERALGQKQWSDMRRGVLNALIEIFRPALTPMKETLSGPDFMLLSGLTSFADWIGSNEKWFQFGTPEDCDGLQGWYDSRRSNAARALDTLGWERRSPLVSEHRTFQELFDMPPRPLQDAVARAVDEMPNPGVILVEAPMGEGKTEAAFYAHQELQRRFGHRGLYIALPTRATGNAMFVRALKFLRDRRTNRTLDVQLLHGATLLNDTFQNLNVAGIHDPFAGGEVRVAEWFTHKKRALLSEYGVGTADQAILPILPVRHNFVRLWGLANRTVIFDEIHAYDAYTGTLLTHLVRWLLALGSSVILLSATLPPSFRKRLAQIVGADMPGEEAEYPRLSIFQTGGLQQHHFNIDSSFRRTVRLGKISTDLSSFHASIADSLPSGGMGLALVNTVQRAQDLFRLFPSGEPILRGSQRIGKRLADGTELFLFHARYPADRRQSREDAAIEAFGPGGTRAGRKILIATQVAEQSLDLDFDVIVTDLAPIDLVLQRAGRLWRHKRDNRPVPNPLLLVAGVAEEQPPSFAGPLWWSSVYREDVLLRTWAALRGRQELLLPDEIDRLVKVVYEDQVEIPESIRDRLVQAMEAAEGEEFAYRAQANQSIIGLPDDASWNQPEKFTLYDDDEPGVHRTLMAQTRLGKDSVIAVPLFAYDAFREEAKPELAIAKQWFRRAVNLSRLGVVRKLTGRGVPSGWKESPLLRNCFPLVMDLGDRWIEDGSVRLDEDLGIIYDKKGAE
jgi:CRISPR-associated endonuclease/helicase Cas3